MFYSESVLAKKGPLARVWLAAHQRKLTKSQLLQTNIKSSVQDIVDQDAAPLALRLSGQLLLGVVRIYSKKTAYLYEDCNETLVTINRAFRAGIVDLPVGSGIVSAHASRLLTLPDAVSDLDLLLPGTETLTDLSYTSFDTLFKIPHTEPRKGYSASLSQGGSVINGPAESGVELGMTAVAIEDPLADMSAGDLDIDIGLNDDSEQSLELGRDAPPPRRLSEEFGSELGVGNMSERMPDDDNQSRNGSENPVDFAPIVDEPLSPGLSSQHDITLEDTRNGKVAKLGETLKRKREVRKRLALIDDVTELASRQVQALVKDTSGITIQWPNPKAWASMKVEMVLHPNLSHLLSERLTSDKRKGRILESGSPKRMRANTNFDIFNIDNSMDHGVTNIPSDHDLPHDDGFVDAADHSLLLDVPMDNISDACGWTVGQDDTIPKSEHAESVAASDIQASMQVHRSETDKRAHEAKLRLANLIKPSSEVAFNQLTEETPRAVAVDMFIDILCLATKGLVNIYQAKPYDEIRINAPEGFVLPSEMGCVV